MYLKNRFHLTFCEEYGMWLTFMRACYNPKSPDYKNFGAKGFYPYKEWQTFSKFKHNAFFGRDDTSKRYVLSLWVSTKPNPDGKPKRLGPRSVSFSKISFEEIERRKKVREELREEKRKEAMRKWERSVCRQFLNSYYPKFFTFVDRLDYSFDYDWLVSFDNPEKLKFLLKYSKKKHKTIPVDDMEYFVNFVNHFYDDEQFNKVYENWLDMKDSSVSPALDHIYPKSKGGSNDLDNLRFITNAENYFKGTKTLEEWECLKKNQDKFFI